MIQKTSGLLKLDERGEFDDVNIDSNPYMNGVYFGNNYMKLSDSLKKRPSNNSMFLGDSIKRQVVQKPLM